MKAFIQCIIDQLGLRARVTRCLSAWPAQGKTSQDNSVSDDTQQLLSPHTENYGRKSGQVSTKIAVMNMNTEHLNVNIQIE